MQTRTLRNLQLGLALSATVAALAFVSAATAFVSVEPTSSIISPAGITQVDKNQAWPLKGRITMNPCADFVCVEV